jgi:uncharacterized protein YbjT (DUF2867 family)
VNSRVALLLGASGLVGNFCLRSLLADPTCTTVISVGRRKLKDPAHPKLVQEIIELNALASLTWPSIDDVFCALGTTIRKAGSQQALRRVDMDFPLAAARQALQFGAKQFVLVSAVGADSNSKNFYLRTKGEIEKAVTLLPFQAVHIFRPSFLLGKRTESTPGESLAVAAGKIFQYLCVGPAQAIPSHFRREGRASDGGNSQGRKTGRKYLRMRRNDHFSGPLQPPRKQCKMNAA